MKKNTRNVLIGVIIVLILALLAVFLLLFSRIKSTKDYNEQLSLGDKYLQEMNYEDAAIAFQNAIQINEKKETGHIRLADVYMATEDYDQAADVLLTGYNATGESDLIRDRIIAVYPQVSNEYKEKIEEKIGREDLESASQEDTQPDTAPAPEEEPENAVTGSVVTYDDKIFYWKYNAQSYETSGALAYFGSGWLAPNQLICRSVDGTEQVLLESSIPPDEHVQDCGTLGISGGKLFFDMPDPNSTDVSYTSVFSYSLDSGEIINYGGGHLKAVTDDGRAIGYTHSSYSLSSIFVTNEDGTLTTLASDAVQYLDYRNKTVYFEPQESYESATETARATLACVSLEDQQVRNLYTVTADFPVNNNTCVISQMAYRDDQIYFAYGSYGGTALLYQGGKVACVGADGSNGHIASGSEIFYEPCFQIAEDGSAVVDDPDFAYTSNTMQTYYTIDGNIYFYNREAGGQPELLVSPADYASFASGLCGVFDSTGIGLEEAALIDGKVYYLLNACTEDPSASIGWRTGYSRQVSALFEKDLETGTVTEIYRY